MDRSRAPRIIALTAAVALAGGACSAARRPSAAPVRPVGLGKVRLAGALRTFEACDDLLDYLHRQGSEIVGPYGFANGITTMGVAGVRDQALAGPAPMAAVTGATASGVAAAATAKEASSTAESGDHSTTNVQEDGVDEPDFVKSDGRRVVTLTGNTLRVVDVTGETPELQGTLGFDDRYGQAQLLLAGDRVLVLHPTTGGPGRMMVGRPGRGSADVARPRPAPGIAYDESYPPAGPPRVEVTVVDIAESGAPKVVSDLGLDGSLVAARMVHGVARLVLRSGPPNLPFVYPSASPQSSDAATEANRAVIAKSTLDQWLPGFSYDEPGAPDAHRQGLIGDCASVTRPETFSGIGMLSVVSVAADDPRPGPAATVVGAGDIVYASPEHLYVTSTAWPAAGVPRPPAGASNPMAPADTVSTAIHEFDISDPVRTAYLASGAVNGAILGSYSLSEHDDLLRVATGNASANSDGSTVSVFQRDGAVLTMIGSVGGLGKGERIYGVRFLGDRGYVVTFRQMDPLHVIDLSDGAHPTLLGELEIPGYSAYLHPVGDHRLLGVGEAGTAEGRPLGAQVSLFDVSDPSSPKRLADAVIGAGHSEVEFDPHAFLFWAKTGLAVVPLQQEAVGVTVGAGDITPLGSVRQRDGSPVRRALVIGESLLTVSDTGIATSDLQTMASRSWLSYAGGRP